MDFTRVRTRLALSIQGFPLMQGNKEYSVEDLCAKFLEALERKNMVTPSKGDMDVVALANYGVRGHEVMRAGIEYKVEDLLHRYFHILERCKLVVGVPGYEAILEEVLVEEDESPPLDPKHDLDDPRFNEKTSSYPVAEGQMDLSEFEDKSWRKYLTGKDLDGIATQAVSRARVKMGLDEPEDE